MSKPTPDKPTEPVKTTDQPVPQEQPQAAATHVGHQAKDTPDSTNIQLPSGDVVTKDVPNPSQSSKRVDGKEVHADHASVRVKRESTPQQQEKRDRNARDCSGNLGGKFILVGNSLVKSDAITRVELPREGDENPTLILRLFGGDSVSVAGEELNEIMGDMGLKFLPALPSTEHAAVQEDGRLLTPRDASANADPNRIQTIPVGPKGLVDVPLPPKSAKNPPTAENVEKAKKDTATEPVKNSEKK